MAVSHQSGVIHQHWNDPPPATFATKTPTPSSTPALPTPPMTPSIERTSTPELIRGLQELLGIPSMLVGRNKEMVFTRVRGLIRDIQEGKMPESQQFILEGIIRDIRIEGKGIARDRIVKFMSQERGIAAWATALRMVIENVAS